MARSVKDVRDRPGGGRPSAVPVALREVGKLYRRGGTVVRALDGVSAEFGRHSFTAVMGPSGSGKSTLLHCAAGLERPTSGSVWLAGQDLGRLSEKRLTRLRRSSVGFVFQAFNLVPALTVRETFCCRCASLTRGGIPDGQMRSSGRSAWRTGCATARRSFPAARSSGWRSPGPW